MGLLSTFVKFTPPKKTRGQSSCLWSLESREMDLSLQSGYSMIHLIAQVQVLKIPNHPYMFPPTQKRKAIQMHSKFDDFGNQSDTSGPDSNAASCSSSLSWRSNLGVLLWCCKIPPANPLRAEYFCSSSSSSHD